MKMFNKIKQYQSIKSNLSKKFHNFNVKDKCLDLIKIAFSFAKILTYVAKINKRIQATQNFNKNTLNLCLF